MRRAFLLTASSVSLIPPIAVHGPKPISIFQALLTAVGMSESVELRRREGMVAVSPASILGLRESRCIVKFCRPRDGMCLWRLSGLRKTIDRSKSERVIEVTFGWDEWTLVTGRVTGMLCMVVD